MSQLRIALLVVAVAAVIVLIGRGLTAAERRGWVRLHGTGKGTASGAFSVMEDIFSPGRNEARHVQEAQKRMGNRAPTPGDGLDDGPASTGRYGGRLTIPAAASDLSRSTTPGGNPPTNGDPPTPPTDRAGAPG